MHDSPDSNLRFMLGVVVMLGFLPWLTYTAVGLTALPLALLRGPVKPPSLALGEAEDEQRSLLGGTVAPGFVSREQQSVAEERAARRAASAQEYARRWHRDESAGCVGGTSTTTDPCCELLK